MVTMIMIVTYIRIFSIKYYLVHILAKYWSSKAYIKRKSILQMLDTLKIKTNFTKSSAIF